MGGTISGLSAGESVTVTTGSGEEVVCEAYVIPPEARQVLTQEFWDADWFEQHELARYLQG